MFGGGNNAPMMPGPGNNPAAAGYGPPPEQNMEMGYNQQNPNAPPGFGNAPPTGQFPGQAGYGQTPPGYNPGSAAGPAPTLTRMNSTSCMNLIWFAAACSAMVGALISFISELFSLEWVDALEMAYLFILGFFLAVIDTPLFGNFSIVSDLRTAIGKYIAILNRVTGKGATYIFLGCALWSSMFANLEGGFFLFLAVLIGLFVVVVGIFSMAIAILKSRNLNLVRIELRKDNPQQSLKQMYDMHAKMNPTAGITQEEFKKMTPYARGVSFEQGDIKLIFNALSSHPRRDYISLEDLQAWVNGSMMVLI